VTRFVLLDSERLGMASKPSHKLGVRECHDWINDLRDAGTIVVVPEIIRYEVRRDLIRAGATSGLRRIDDLAARLAYLPLTALALDRAAELWAAVRKSGRSTAPDEALDIDAILAAQALTMTMAGDGDEVIIATSNVRHLTRFPGVDAREWETIV
jgi:predicted nucleic acid-binding protein